MSDRVARLAQNLMIAAAFLQLAGCVSTTSGPPVSESNDKDAAAIHFQLGIQYFGRGNYELARDRLVLSTELDPSRAIVWSTLATTYEQIGNQRLAEQAHNKALKTGPRDFDVQNRYALFLCGQRRFDEAEKYFERSIGAETNDFPELMMTNAGVCLSQKPDYPKAEEYFRRALERRPNYAEALVQMALLKHQTGADLMARAFLQRYQSLSPPSPGVLYLCVLIEGKLGDEKASTECSNELLREFPNSAESRRVLGN
jgi:type IV pilus assembly protein PilF